MIGAVLFDLDGTLVDSLDDIATALDASLADHGHRTFDRATVRDWIGGGARQLVAQALEAQGGGDVDRVLASFRTHYAAAPVVHTRVYDGIASVLDALDGLPLAILSNKPHALTVAIADKLLARWPWRVVAGAREGVALKPDPAAALAIARELGIPASRCAYVGDSAIDVAMAQAAGMYAVAVAWGFRPRAELVAAKPALLVDTPDQLRSLLTATS